jgi:CRP-like cAMP-binding protein
MQLRNTFLSSLEPPDFSALSSSLREVTLGDGQCLGERGDPAQWVYFPGGCAISFVAVMADGREIETASVGCDGVTGLANALADEALSTRMIARIGGGAFALPAAILRQQAERSPALMRLILRHLRVAMEQAEHSVVCHAAHQLPARLARWLLTCQDWVDRPIISLTQDAMGSMTGSLRSSISVTAGEFKLAGLIRYSRGHVEILDRSRLENLACECYWSRAPGARQLPQLVA